MIIQLGENRTLTIPEDVYAQLGMEPGDPFSIHVAEGNLTISSVSDFDSPERIASFHLNNAITVEDYDWAVAEVKRMGLDPSKIAFTDPNKRVKLGSDADLQKKFASLHTSQLKAS